MTLIELAIGWCIVVAINVWLYRRVVKQEEESQPEPPTRELSPYAVGPEGMNYAGIWKVTEFRDGYFFVECSNNAEE